MAKLINLKTISDSRGSLTVIENLLPFSVERVFYIYNVGANINRGGHRHIETIQALVCVSGECSIENNNGRQSEIINLNSPDKCLILYPEDWHIMSNFTENCVLLVFASKKYSPEDYIYEKY